jgi:mono/diheme cytochrome c family protein
MRYVFRPLPFPMNRLNAFLIAAPAALLLAALPSCKPADPIVIERKAPGDEPAAEAAGPQLPETISFNEHVQPILSENCYQCHGPDANTREPKDAPLRLDIAEHAMTPRENGKPVIIPGEPAASLLVKLMHSDKASEIMPPPESHKTMDADEIAILEKWIEQGAEYQDHWAFIPPTKADLPDAGKDWASQSARPLHRRQTPAEQPRAQPPRGPRPLLPPPPPRPNRFAADFAGTRRVPRSRPP